MTHKNTRGLVQIFTGSGKGKTTAALGTVIRAAGHNLKISVIFFIKGRSSQGEYKTLAALPNVKVASFGLRQFIHKESGVNPAEKAQAQAALAAARQDVASGDFDLVVLDEVNIAVHFHLLEVDEVLQLIKDKPPHVELILTGRGADEKLIEIADLVTEMVKIKHPFDKGIKARKGIEY
ncbi:MAG: cob(I)yrinic acid a,c-diamide adenosyltransferase [Chloroflexi bacterium RBG_16_50_11]|nr:MAG: cob(I)yrinic acid a,c-diamide adenosyltransferase [Chloroflexi bacterium RBG_16_50_11]